MQPLLYVFFFVVAGVFVALLVEARLRPRPFAGPLLASSFAPFIVCACISFVRLHRIILTLASDGILDFEAVFQGLHYVEAPFYLGFASSGGAFLIHLLFYLLGQRSRTA